MSSRWGSVFLASIAALGVGEAASADDGLAASATACSRPMPTKLAAPAGNELAFAYIAEGVQIYSCVESEDAAPGAPAWALQSPEATLIDRHGRTAGTHGAGPSWQALDGSSVVGAKVEAATSDPSAIPWVLLRVASHQGGRGRMTDVTFVQRRETSGGIAPSTGCNADTVGAVARVPYRAVYCFYRGPGNQAEGEGTKGYLSGG